MRGRVFRDQKRAGEVHGEHPVPVGERLLLHRLFEHDAGVVHDDVEPTVGRGDRFDGGGN